MWNELHRTDLFFVTLDKSGGDFSPTTSYNDYPDLSLPVPLGVAGQNSPHFGTGPALHRARVARVTCGVVRPGPE